MILDLRYEILLPINFRIEANSFWYQLCNSIVIFVSKDWISEKIRGAFFPFFIEFILSLSLAVCFRRHGDTHKSRFTVACHKGCFVVRPRGGGRKRVVANRWKSRVRGRPFGRRERATELGMKIAGQTPTFVALVQYGIVYRSTRSHHSLVLLAARETQSTTKDSHSISIKYSYI